MESLVLTESNNDSSGSQEKQHAIDKEHEDFDLKILMASSDSEGKCFD